MDKLIKLSMIESLEEAYNSRYFMTTQIYPLGHDTIFYTCHIVNLDNIAIRFLGYELIYTHGKYDSYCTGTILGKSSSDIKNVFEIDIDSKLKEAIDAAVLEFYNKHLFLKDK